MENGLPLESGLIHIKVTDNSPFPLFKDWHKQASNSDLVQPDCLTFATANREGRVSARTVLLRRLEDDGFVIMTDRRSKKSQELEENPSAAMVFLWNYVKDGEKINSQVRVEGPVVELCPEQYMDLYEREPVFCKIRSHLCHQGAPVDWEEHKKCHDRILDQWRQGESVLPMPDHFVAYKLIAETMEFYYACGNMIGDRVLFVREKDNKSWTHHHIAA